MRACSILDVIGKPKRVKNLLYYVVLYIYSNNQLQLKVQMIAGHRIQIKILSIPPETRQEKRNKKMSGIKLLILKGHLDADRQTDRQTCLLYTSPSPRDRQKSRMPSSA